MDVARPQPREHPLIVAPSEQARLLDVQAVDTRLRQIAHRRQTLPEHGELATLQARGAQLRDELVAAQTETSDVARELAKAEADVELVRQRAARDQGRLQSGQGGHKELESLQHEVQTLSRRQAVLEDIELEIMERHETLTASVERLIAEREGLQGLLDDVTARRDEALAKLDAEGAQLERQRAELVGTMDSGLLALYDKLRAAGGTGAAMLRQRRCEGCRMELNPQDIERIRGAAPDEVVRCEECGGILVRTAESGL